MNRKELIATLEEMKTLNIGNKIIFSEDDILYNDDGLSYRVLFGRYLERMSTDPNKPSILVQSPDHFLKHNTFLQGFAYYLYNNDSNVMLSRFDGPSILAGKDRYDVWGYDSTNGNLNAIQTKLLKCWFEEMNWDYEDFLDTEEKRLLFKLKWL